MPRSYLFIFFLMMVSLLVVGLLEYRKFSDKKLHVVFCNVGQGDATFIRTPGGKTILVDGGPDGSVLDCLSSHMPFWERKINLVLLTHPHQDHFVGLFDVFDHYDIKAFATEKLMNKTKSFENFTQKVKDEKISWQEVTAGDKFRLADGVGLKILGPTKEYLLQTSPNGAIGETQEFASLIALISYDSFDVLLNGDSQASGIQNALDQEAGLNLEVLQVPHHGSKTGLDQALLQILHPKLSIISVGKKNKYGHPATITTDLLHTNGIKFLQTDKVGTIEIISDGRNWKVQ